MQPTGFPPAGAVGGTGPHVTAARALADGRRGCALVRTPGKLAPRNRRGIRQGSITDPIDGRIIRHTLARSSTGQHRDTGAVMAKPATQAGDHVWIVHRAGILSDGPSRGMFQRSASGFSAPTLRDCADHDQRRRCRLYSCGRLQRLCPIVAGPPGGAVDPGGPASIGTGQALAAVERPGWTLLTTALSSRRARPIRCAIEGCALTDGEQALWRREHASGFSVIVDAERYFEVARVALLQARSRIMLVGWDFDARIVLSGDERGEGEPATIGDFLYWLVERTPGLELYLLRWDIGAIKSLFRGTTLLTVLKWMRHPRIHTKLDGHHPTGSSHHQKIVAIDDCFAFCGGIDITGERWDTRAHRDDEPGRHTMGGARYKPWHDATTAVGGPAAAALAELCRDRWHRATGERLEPIRSAGTCWPGNLSADIENARIGIARTIPNMPDQPPVNEIEQLFRHQIGLARRHVYIESQYFASRRIAEAIARRLQEADGPEFVIINPLAAEGWLQPLAMDTARARLMKALQALDRHGRLAMYHPFTAGGEPIYVHAKIMVVDDRTVRIGSANLNNRSMKLDTECDMILDAGDNDAERVGDLARALRDGLLAEHLGCAIDDVRVAIARSDSLIAAVDTLRGKGKTLRPYERPDLGPTTRWLADTELLDPEGPDEMFEPLSRRGLFRGKFRLR
jgi:phosphatidylserine/phosphatidylglycerophosphate/cardiolipin synthase-like enzyme